MTGFTGFASSGSERHLLFLTLNPFQDLFHLLTGLFVPWAATRDTGLTALFAALVSSTATSRKRRPAAF